MYLLREQCSAEVEQLPLVQDKYGASWQHEDTFPGVSLSVDVAAQSILRQVPFPSLSSAHCTRNTSLQEP